MAMKNPPHPGDFIRTEIIEPAGLSVTAAAAALQISRPALSSLLNGKATLSGNMALRIEKAFGVNSSPRKTNPRPPPSPRCRCSRLAILIFASRFFRCLYFQP